MAIRQFALRLDNKSIQSGDITLKELVGNSSPADFTLNNVQSGSGDSLNLITSKAGKTTNHTFAVSVSNAVASVTLSAASLLAIYEDADDGDWDYVEVRWTLGTVDSPSTSQFYMAQNSTVYDFAGWPPSK
jgi:hypothetical protein